MDQCHDIAVETTKSFGRITAYSVLKQ